MNGLTQSLRPAVARNLLRELGEDARGFRFDIAPNPCVGAAVLSGSRVVARGFHRVWGEAHAEVDALGRAAETDIPRADWDTLLVTLEPCSSQGKTPACVDAILASGIKRVIAGALDPDPRHRGKGLERLRDEGLEVLLDPVAAPLEIVAPHFLRWNEFERRRRPRPWTIAKWAQTLTGQLSPPEDIGEGRWISGSAALQEVHLLRSRVDAIVTGVGTVLNDDPRLTVRSSRESSSGAVPVPTAEYAAVDSAAKGPDRVVLDSWLRTPPEARLFDEPNEGDLAGQVHVMSLPGSDPIRRRALEAAGAEVHSGRGMDRHTLDLRDLWTWLADQGFERVMLECGPTLLLSALERGFVDQIRVYTGNVRGGEGESLAPWLTTNPLAERLHREIGRDAVLEAFLE